MGSDDAEPGVVGARGCVSGSGWVVSTRLLAALAAGSTSGGKGSTGGWGSTGG